MALIYIKNPSQHLYSHEYKMLNLGGDVLTCKLIHDQGPN